MGLQHLGGMPAIVRNTSVRSSENVACMKRDPCPGEYSGPCIYCCTYLVRTDSTPFAVRDIREVRQIAATVKEYAAVHKENREDRDVVDLG